jgi:hypothetical protein
LRRLRKGCRAVRTADDVYEVTKAIRSFVEQYRHDLPAEAYQRLRAAGQMADAGRVGTRQACDILSLEIDHALGVLPRGGLLGGIAVGVAVVIAVAVGAAIAYLNLSAVEVVIHNQNCKPITLVTGISPGVDRLLDVVGVDLPKAPIPPGGQAIMQVPPLACELDGTEADRLRVCIAGQVLPLPIAHEARLLQLDGQPLLGQRMNLNLGERPRHELVIECR